jgi:hypothetical protein
METLRLVAEIVLNNWGFSLEDGPVSEQVLAIYTLPKPKGALGLTMRPPHSMMRDLLKLFNYALKIEQGSIPQPVQFSGDSWNLFIE